MTYYTVSVDERLSQKPPMGKNQVARTHGAKSEAKTTHCTPDCVLKLVREVFDGAIGFDPCGHPESHVGAKCTVMLPKYSPDLEVLRDWAFFEKRSSKVESTGVTYGDAFEMEWPVHETTFVNPPYSRRDNEPWSKLISKWAKRGSEVIALVPSSPCAQWWSRYRKADSIGFWLGRLTFRGNNDAADFESAVIYYGPRPEKFRQVFQSACWVVK